MIFTSIKLCIYIYERIYRTMEREKNKYEYT